jgi:hypothetical protein
LVICPSTWGMMMAEARDFSVALYSVVSLIPTDCAT